MLSGWDRWYTLSLSPTNPSDTNHSRVPLSSCTETCALEGENLSCAPHCIAWRCLLVTFVCYQKNRLVELLGCTNKKINKPELTFKSCRTEQIGLRGGKSADRAQCIMQIISLAPYVYQSGRGILTNQYCRSASVMAQMWLVGNWQINKLRKIIGGKEHSALFF